MLLHCITKAHFKGIKTVMKVSLRVIKLLLGDIMVLGEYEKVMMEIVNYYWSQRFSKLLKEEGTELLKSFFPQIGHITKAQKHPLLEEKEKAALYAVVSIRLVHGQFC